MKIILCIDERNGLMFGGRRQSQDSVLRERVLANFSFPKLWMSEYSARQFTEKTGFIVDNDYVTKAEKDDYCFVEDCGFNLDLCNEVVIYKWNRHYPSDVTFDVDLKAAGFKRTSKADFVGSSHKKITEEIYVKKEV